MGLLRASSPWKIFIFVVLPMVHLPWFGVSGVGVPCAFCSSSIEASLLLSAFECSWGGLWCSWSCPEDPFAHIVHTWALKLLSNHIVTPLRPKHIRYTKYILYAI